MDSDSKKTPSNDDSQTIPLWSIWNIRQSFQIPNTSYTIKGFSVAALRTNFFIKELNIMLDAGLSSPYCPEHIFITHGHADHTANLPFHLYNKKENVKIQVYSPKEIVQPIKEYIESAYILSSDVDFLNLGIKREELYLYKYYEGVGVSPKQIINFTIKNKKFEVEVINCHHSVPCVGYGFSEKRQKLKDEFKTLQGKEIGELRKKGIDIYYEADFPFLLFLGDTSKEIFLNESLNKYPVIMIECTFIADEDYDQAEKTLHIHWKDLEIYIQSHPNQIFILYHFSQRYKKKELVEFFSKKDYKNIVTWIH
jgi:ribonuclease Z